MFHSPKARGILASLCIGVLGHAHRGASTGAAAGLEAAGGMQKACACTVGLKRVLTRPVTAVQQRCSLRTISL